jgi:hypothetical protein
LQAVDVQACAKALRCCMQMQDKARVYISGSLSLLANHVRLLPLFFFLSN